MKKANIRKIVSIALAMTLFGTVVSASGITVNFSKDITAGTINVEATSVKDDVVTIQILPQTVTPEMIAENPALGEQAEYVKNAVAGEDGKVMLSFPIKTGDYTLYVASSVSEESYYEEKFNYLDSNAYSTLIGELKQLSKEDFLNTIKSGNNLEQIGFNIDICSDDAINRFYDEYKGAFSETDYELNLNNFKKCALIEILNKNGSADILNYIDQIYKEDTALLSYLSKYVSDAEKEAHFINRMRTESNNAIVNSNDLIKTVKEALILTVVKYPIEANNIKLILDEYKSVMNMTSVSSYTSIYRGLAGNDYRTIADFKKVYNSAISDAAGNNSGGGGGGGAGGGGGGGSVTPSTGSSNPVGIPSTAGQTQNMKIFDDVDSVEWAKPAIEALYKAGIVSGKGDQKFYPQDNVSREEFVKMLVATFDIKLVGEEVPFSDVLPNAWYYDYVKTAYLAGVVSGVNDTTFGTGNKITRQDICVMTYRMLNECDIKIPEIKEEIKFGDYGAISDYAKESVLALQKSGIINGDNSGNFNPKATATRAETAKIMHGVLSLIGKGMN